jgi:hypothetical protein
MVNIYLFQNPGYISGWGDQPGVVGMRWINMRMAGGGGFPMLGTPIIIHDNMSNKIINWEIFKKKSLKKRKEK